MNIRFVRTHKAYCAIIVFLITMALVHTVKPKKIKNANQFFPKVVEK